MDTVTDQSASAVPAALEREMAMVREAIALISNGGSPRVVLCGLHFGNELLEPATWMARRAGVRVVPLWTLDETVTDLAIERRAE
jgi:hypothetical protein